MVSDFELNLDPLRRLISRSPEVAGRGARRALGDIKDDWVQEARDIAPLDKSNLRQQITGEVEGRGLNSKVIVTANAAQDGFNYGYYIHEGHMAEDGKSLKHSGTVEKFLDESVDEAKYQRWIEEEIQDALKRAGW